MPKVSVIIPVYGVEKYIERCARSLFEQTLDDIEYLFIDDCTPDRSIEILNKVLKEYPNRQSQIVIHRMEQNSGQAAVRKWGIENATGEFIIHCDSDDWVNINAYKSCYDNALFNNSDIVFFDYDVTDGIHHSLNRRSFSTNKYYIIGKLLSGQLMGSLWGMLVKKSLYKGVKYYPADNFCEDLVLSIQLVNTGIRYSYIEASFYYYFQSDLSITAKGTLEKTLSSFHQIYNNTELIISYLKDVGIVDNFKDEILTRKLMNLKMLYPFSNISAIRNLCRKSYQISMFDVICKKDNTYNVKWFYILYILRIASYAYKLNKLIRKK